MPVRVPKTNPYRGTANATAYQRKVKALKVSPEGGVCWLCGEAIDRTLPPSESNSPFYWTADHVVPLANGGDLLGELRPAHKHCNSQAGRALQDLQYADFDPETIEHSRNW